MPSPHATDSEENWSTSGAGYVYGSSYVSSSIRTPDIEQAYTLRYAIDLHVHESCVRVAVRVLHYCAFLETEH